MTFAAVDTTQLGGVTPLSRLVGGPIAIAVARGARERESHLEAAAVEREKLFTDRVQRVRALGHVR